MIDRDMLAAEYALGVLDAEQRADVTRRANDDVALRLAIEEWEARLAPIAEATQPQTPPADLFAKIEARIDRAAEPAGTRTIRQADGAWRPFAPGVVIKILNRVAETRRQTALLKIDPGADYPDHDHDDEEEMFIVEGDLVFGDFELGPGDYHHAKPGGAHPPSFSRTGCTAIVISHY